MGKGENPKRKDGAQKTKVFNKKKNGENYDAYAKEIDAFCKKSENRGLGVRDLARRAHKKLGFNDKSFGAVESYIRYNVLVPASGKAAGNKPKESANDLLATHPTEDAAMDVS